MVHSGYTSGVYKIPTEDQYENAMEGDTDVNKKS